jgi:DNA-binding response OmpR family regulator
VESELGRGSTFRLYLPRVDAVEVERPAPSRDKVPKVSKGTETILVVEDDADVRDLAAQILETQGYRVLTAENGHDALRISEELETAIDLLLTDLVLPRMNGRELAQRLEAQQSAVRVLYMTGYGDRLIADHGVLDGSVAVLSKPFTMETLLHKVRSRLDAGM